MANDHGITPGSLFVAFIAGAAVGAAVALVFAPASGEQTRDYLNQRAREILGIPEEEAVSGQPMWKYLPTAEFKAAPETQVGSFVSVPEVEPNCPWSSLGPPSYSTCGSAPSWSS